MSEPHPELERPWYFKLSYEQLEAIDDAESRFERGVRLVHAIGVLYNRAQGKDLIASAARMGHPVAIACVEREKRHQENPSLKYEVEPLYRCASEGHPYGKPLLEPFDSIAIYQKARDFLTCHGTFAGVPDYKAWADTMRIGADLGYALCQNELSQALFRASDHVNGISYLRRAAVQGHADSQMVLGRSYKYEARVRKNRMMAFCWIHRSSDLNGVPAEPCDDMMQTPVRPLGACQLAQKENELAAAVLGKADPKEEAKAFEWLLTQNLDEAAYFIRGWTSTKALERTVDSLLPMPISEEMAPHLVFLGPGSLRE